VARPDRAGHERPLIAKLTLRRSAGRGASVNLMPGSQ
jgi:hypothetical protein